LYLIETCLSTRGRRRHKIQCQLRLSLVAGLNGTLCLKWSSAVLMLQIWMQALPLWARMSLTS